MAAAATATTNDLTQIFKDLFTTIESNIINNLKSIFQLEKRQVKDYENFKTYCLKHPTKLFDVIDHLYPYIVKNGNNDPKNIIDKLKTDFKEDKPIQKFLTEYSEKILVLMNSKYLFIVIKQILKTFLLNILKYHEIYQDSDNTKKIKFLIKKEYLHRERERKRKEENFF